MPGNRTTIFLLAAWVLLQPGASHAQTGETPNWRLAAALYPYQHRVNDDVDTTVTISGNLPGRFSYFSFSNFTGLTSSESVSLDRSEQNLRMTIVDSLPLDLNLQVVLQKGGGNDFYQGGISWRINDTPGLRDLFDRLNLVWRMTVHAKRWNVDSATADAWSIEHGFRMTVPEWTDRVYLSGFYEKTYGQDRPAGTAQRPLVSEVQLGARLWKALHVVAEYRVNEFRIGDEHNLAAGIEFQGSW